MRWENIEFEPQGSESIIQKRGVDGHLLRGSTD